jgi:hypothetical protein
MANTLSYANSIDVTDADKFIPDVWSDEIIAAYKANLVLANLVTTLNHKGKKGDVVHIPKPSRGSASAKAANNVVTLITSTDSEVTITINKHYEYSYVIEDIVELQALASKRRFLMEDAGYALSKQVDSDVRDLAATWNSGTAYSGAVIGSDGSTAYSASANTNTGNGAALTDAGVRRVIQFFDDGDVPGRDRVFVIPPVEKKRLLGVTRFTEQAFTGESGSGNSIRNGLVGNMYGVEVFVSSNIASILATDASTAYRVCLAFQKSALVLVEQQGVRVQTQNKLEALGTLMVADRVYGVKTLREEGVRAIVVPSIG